MSLTGVCVCVLYMLQAKAKFLEVGKRMRDYEVRKHQRWSEEAVQTLDVLMNRKVLLTVKSSGDTCRDAAQPEVRNTQTPNNFYPETDYPVQAHCPRVISARVEEDSVQIFHAEILY